jgi:hypothetical protein
VEPCCKRECLLSHGYEAGVHLATQCIEELQHCDKKQKKDYLMEKIRSCIATTTTKGYFSFNWTIGLRPGKIMQNVCRDCFCNAYCCGTTYVDVLIQKIKRRDRNSDGQLGDAQRPVQSAFVKSLIDLAASFDIELSPRQIASLTVPKTVASLTCFAWMQSFFDSVGDKQPNHNEIHLEPTDIKTVHAEYHQVVGDCGEPVLEYQAFLRMWASCFPHVKIREFKAVSGKCTTCCLLSEARRKQMSLAGRRYLTELHALHRTMYMGERLDYYERRNNAMLMPRFYWSGIGDGMMQAHCVLPHRGNMVAAPQTLSQHIQGMIAHGRSIEIYRTFHNVPVTSNLATHCLLLALEKVQREEGRVPDTVYYQIDGGPENTSNAALGIAELIIVRGLAKKVVITRLPVGHTHEDIDSKFAIIWKRIRNKFVLSPVQYARDIEVALTTDKTPCNVNDIFIVPNYADYIKPYLDPNLGRYAKRYKDTDWTQLQYEFVSVEPCDSFPLGSRMTYRKYSQNEVILIQASDSGAPIGFSVLKGTVKDQPEAQPPHCPLGMFVLRELPPSRREIHPEPFIVASRETLEKVVKYIVRTFSQHLPEIVDEWNTFMNDVCPQDDDAERYMREKGMHIPLFTGLFSGGDRVNSEVAADSTAINPTDITFTASMRWSGRGGDPPNISDVPFVSNSNVTPPLQILGTQPVVRKNRKRRADRSPSPIASSDSEPDEDIYNYVDLTTADPGARDYIMKYVGKMFDDDDDGGTFRVSSVCAMQKVGGRRSSNTEYAFKYVDIDGDSDDFLYTPVREMLNSCWCKWKHSSRRAVRMSQINESPEQPVVSSSTAATAAPSCNRFTKNSKR